jgi:hypothetical protein
MLHILMTESAGLYSVNMSSLAEFSLATQIIINPRCRCTCHPVQLRVFPDQQRHYPSKSV